MLPVNEPVDLPALSYASQLDRLREVLFQSGEPVYVFVDPLLLDPFDRSVLAMEGVRSESVPLKDWGIGADQCPYFIRLPNSTSERLHESYAMAAQACRTLSAPRPICGWFSSTLEPAQICHALKNEMVRRRPLKKQWLFRFFDPRVVGRLTDLLGSEYRVAGADRWWYLDQNGWLQSVRGRGQSLEPGAITEAGFAAMSRCGIVNRSLDMWQESQGALPDDAYDRADMAATRALELGLVLEDEADCATFILHRCLIHPSIERHPIVSGWIADARDKKKSYAALAASADADLWAQIESGHWMRQEKGG